MKREQDDEKDTYTPALISLTKKVAETRAAVTDFGQKHVRDKHQRVCEQMVLQLVKFETLLSLWQKGY